MTILKSKPSGPVLCRPMHKGPYKAVVLIVWLFLVPLLSFGQSAGTIGTNQCINSGATPAAFTSLTPENFPLGLFFTGYQWQYSSSSSGPFTTVPEHVTEDEDFDEYAVTSPVTATTYWRRAAIVFNVFIWAPEAYYSNVIVVGINPTVTPQTPLPVICEGAPTYSLGYTTTGGPNQYNILWNPAAQGAGFTNVNAAFSSNNLAATSGSLNVSVPGSATGSFNGTIAVRVSATGCSSSNIATGVTINPRPTATITPLGPTTFCAGGSVTLTASAGSSWAWSSGETTQLIVVSSTSSRTVTVTNSYGCSNTSSAQAVTVNPLPIATITAGGPITFCAGGSVTLTASAGSSWLWSNGATTQSITVNTTGNRTVEVTNANGCKNTSAAQSITVNSLPVATIAAGGPITFCAGGSVTLTASAGSSWLWSNGATTQSITVNTTGNRTVEVTDANGCKNTSAAQSITVNPLPVATITAGGPITFCADQSVTLTASAGSSWLWSNGATTQSITVNTTGNRTVEVTDANGCKNTSAARSITVNPLPVATITPGGPITFCAGGSVTLTASAGSSWLWSNGATTQSITVNTTGNRTVEVTNANGCKNTSAAQSITVNPLPVATITAGGSITFCADQSVTLTASAGSSWLWSNGATTQSITVNTTGNRTVEVTDANGCKNTSSAQSITVNPLPVATIAAGGPITFCADQSVTLTASAGTSWLWSNGATTQSIIVNTTGNRTVEVTDANGCKNTSAARSITVNPLPVATITAGGPITFCAGGSVTLTASAGSSWLWSNGATTQSITVNTTGNRTVEVTDANGCKNTSSAQSITVNPLPVATITAGGPITFCAGGSVTLTASAGSSWLWSNGATTQSITVNTTGNRTVEVTDANGCKNTSAAQSITVNPLPVATITAGGPITFCADQSVTLTASAGSSWLWSNGATTQSITVNTTGNRTVEVTDANGCKNTSAAQSITVNPLPVATITAGGPITFCADQSVTLTASAGTSWLWSNGATTQSITVNTTGNRTVEVTDANGCKNSSAAQSITVNPLPVATITAGGPITFCADQSVTLTASAGTSWLWSNGATTQSITVNTTGNRTVEVTDANGCKNTSAAQSITVNPLPVATITAGGPITFCADQSTTLTTSAGSSWLWSNGATTQSITVNTSGNRTVEVTDANGCKSTSAALSITVNPLPVATITAGGAITFCADQSVTLTASAGTSWLWSNGATTQSITVNTTGNRTVEVTDANGCKNTSSTQSITVNPLPVATITAGGPITFCADQSVTLTASTGSSWLWSNGATTQSITVNTTGNRTVAVTDANGCKNTSVAQSITVNPLPVATITAGGPITFCADQSVTLTASAGSSWLWSNGATTQSITVNATGNRTVEVTDANGCKNTSAAQSITVNPLPVATITAGGPITFCADQSVTLTASAGTSWLWSNGATTQSITVNTTGNRTVEVTDANGCKNTSAAQSITVNPLPVATITAGGPITFCADQSVTLTASAGSSWLWSNGATTQSITVNTSGNRTVEVTDANGCKNTSAAQSITVNPLPVATITAGGPITFCADQSVTLTASAGSSWLWSNGATTQSITVNTTGNRTVEVTDANGCKNTSATQSITVNPLPVATITAGGPITFCADQSVTLTASAGSSWLWSNGATTQSITVNTTGNRTVEVTDANGCKNTSAAQSITVNPLPVATITAGGPITFCADQSVTLTASAGSSWLWSNGATTQSITVNTSGNRTVEVTDANGCKSTSAAQSITVNPLPVATITAGGPITFCADQSVTLTASAGSSWLWSNGATTQSIAVNTSGNRTVEVTDANGCKNTSSAQSISVNPLPVAAITAGGSITFCADQSVTLTASAGSSWLWSNGATTQSITVNTTGNRTVEVTDANGCKNTSAAQSITVNPLPVATITASGSVTFCADQSVTLTASAGSSWLWSNGATTQSITVNTTGNRTVEVTDANGCKNTSSAQSITVNPLPVATITAGGPITFCADQSVTLTASAGSSWLWSNGATTQSITVNTSGNRTVEVTDANGCKNTSAAQSITVNPLPVATITAGGSITFCADQSVTLTASAGSSWLWSNGATTQSITVNTTGNRTVEVTDANGCKSTSTAQSITVNPLPVATITAGGSITFCADQSVILTASAGSSWLWSNGSTTQSITVNTTGNRTVEVTDANGCKNTSAAQSITVNPLPVATITAGGPITFCADQSVTLSASAGSSWLWSNGATTQSITINTTGNRTVEVTDANGCKNTSAAQSITVNPLPVATITAGGSITFCADQSVILTASAGSSWLWSNGSTTQSITVNTTGNRTVEVTDANGCKNTSSAQSITVNPLPVATITAGGPVTFCADQSVTLTASAGSSWLWSNGATTQSITVNTSGNRTVEVTDANGCKSTSAALSITVNPLPVATITAGGAITFCADQSVTLTASAGTSWLWSNGATTQSITVNTTGNRTVEVTDANGCKNTSSTQSITVNPLPVATITAGGPITFCADQSVTLTASAGSSWLWSNGATTQSITVNTTGNRTVEVTDANGCKNTSVAQSITVNPLPVATITAGGPITFCADQSVTLTASAGSSWLWSNGATTQSITVNTTGNRTVEVTDANGCKNTSAAQSITVNPLPVATITAGGPITFCADQSVTLTASAGTSWLWSNGATTQSITVNTTGNRTVEVTDANGCKNTSAAQSITVNPLPVATITAGGPITFCADQSVTLTASAGSSWLWSNGATTQSITVNTTGNRTVEVTDANGCKNTSVAQSVTVNPLPVATITAGGPITFCADQSVTLTASAGTSWLWSNGATTQSITVNTTGNRTVEVTDANGCKSTSAALSITVNPLPVATITAGGPITFCADQSVTLTASAGTSWLWSNGATTQSITVNTTGNRTVEVTDANGCKNTSSAQSITVNPLPVATITAGGPITFCADQSVTLTASAGSSWLWSNGATTQSITVNTTGNRTVEVTDANGCKNTSSAQSITVNPLPVATITAGGPITFCADQSVTLTASAGSSWLWSNGATTQSITVNTTGNRTVEVTDANGCKNTSAGLSITVNPLPVATITAGGSITFCADQSVTLTASAGSSWLWSNGATTQSITVNTTGNRTVEVTDGNGCKNTSSAQSITVNPLPVATITAGGPITFCADQSVTLTASAGSSWLWSNGATTQSITVNTTGNRTVEVTDANGCKNTSAAQSITVNPLPVATITAGGPITFCADQSVTLTASAGSSWLWSNGETTQSVTVNTTGSRTVEVTDGNGCKTTSSGQGITVNPLPTATITAASATTFCAGGSVILTASAGTSWLWNTGETTQSITVNNTSNKTVIVKDGNGCENTSAAEAVTVNSLPVATISAGSATTFCSGESVTLTASPGSSWLWSTGETTRSITVTGTSNNTVTVKDGNGCENSSVGTSITVNPLPAATIIAATATTFCAGASVLLTASPGSSWIWSSGETSQSITVNSTADKTVQVTDANGCRNTSSVQSVTVNPLPTPVITAGGPATFCAGGSVTLTASAGTAWLWSSGETTQSITVTGTDNKTVEVTDGNGCSNTSAITSITVNTLPAATITAGGPATFCAGESVTLTASAGTAWLWSSGETTQSITVSETDNKTVRVTDANGCQNVSTIQSVHVNPLPAATITAGGTTTFCAGGSVTLTASAGSSWLWSNGETTRSITIGNTANRSVQVTDANGCRNTSTVQAVTVNPLPVATISAGGPTAVCEGSTVLLSASAGSSWLWNTGETTRSVSVTATSGRSVTVTDANGCSSTTPLVSVMVNPLPSVPVISGTTAFCDGSSSTLSVNAAHRYLWNTGATTSSVSVNKADRFSVTVFDENGCSNTQSVQTTVYATPVLQISKPAAVCSPATVDLTSPAVHGGDVSLLSYFTDAAYTTALAQPSAVQHSGTYYLRATSLHGCTASGSVGVTVNASPVLTLHAPAAVCSPATIDLSAAAVSAGSTTGLQYSYWTNASATAAVSNATALASGGTFYIKGTTAEGCSSVQSVQVIIHRQPVLSVTTPAAVCAPASVNLTAAQVTAGSQPGLQFSYWQDAAATSALSNPAEVISSNLYYIKATEPLTGCSITRSVQADVYSQPSVHINNPKPVCEPKAINLTEAIVTENSTPSLSYSFWADPDQTLALSDATVRASGTYYIKGTSPGGCSVTKPVKVTVNALPVGSLANPSEGVICEGSPVLLTAVSNASSFEWYKDEISVGTTTVATFEADASGKYTVQFKSKEGCVRTADHTVRLSLVRKPVLTFQFENRCEGQNTFFRNQSFFPKEDSVMWSWNFGDGSSSPAFAPSHKYAAAGTYTIALTLNTVSCPDLTKTIQIPITIEAPRQGIKYDTVRAVAGEDFILTARSFGTQYRWLPPAGLDNAHAKITAGRLLKDGSYTVNITSEAGCVTTDSVWVKVGATAEIYVPQAFSPNGDGHNDRLHPNLVAIKKLNFFRIYNRWGNIIFQTSDASPQNGWNGKSGSTQQQTGTYSWVAEGVDAFGNTIRRSGTVLLVN